MINNFIEETRSQTMVTADKSNKIRANLRALEPLNKLRNSKSLIHSPLLLLCLATVQTQRGLSGSS